MAPWALPTVPPASMHGRQGPTARCGRSIQSLGPRDTAVARSRRKTPASGISTAVSDKADKQASHRKVRRAVRQLVPIQADPLLPLEKQLTNPASLAKDGKARFDPTEHPELMRK